LPSSSVVFLFSGQGYQFPNMAADRYASEPIFRSHLDRCADQLTPHLGLDLRDVLFPNGKDAVWAANHLNRTSVTQPALFSLEYSLAQWWMALSVRPQAMVGHSIGEYVAACVADVMSLEDALAITSIRGQLMESCVPGSMLAVSISPENLPLSADLWLAAVNAPEQCVGSGTKDAVARLERKLFDESVSCRRLQTFHAFHSAMMDSILESFQARMSEVALRPPQIPYLSNLTGTWITAA
jgi:acyl transferase domain-containing protein